MSASPSSSAAWVRGVVQLFTSQGVEAPRLFREAGVDIGHLGRPHLRYSTEEVSRLWRAAVEISGQPALGLNRELARRFLDFRFADKAMASSPHLLGGLQGLSRYLHLIGDSTAFDLRPERGDCWLELTGWADHMPRQRVEFGMMGFLLVAQHVTRHPLRLAAAEFTFSEPADFHAHRMAFQCPMRFGRTQNRIRLRRDDLALPVVGARKTLAALHEHVIEQRLHRLGEARTTYRASEEIIRRLHLGEPSRRDVARSLGLSDAALGQRLRTEGQTFEALLDDVRKELATHYLSQAGYALGRIAGLLGWQTAADVTGACRRWWGLPPAQYRQRLAAGRPAS